jgi:DNA recombination protein RmuC
LKGDSRKQGNWGEIVLERILENSGLRRNEEYFIQETHTGEDGRRARPDVIVRLPESKDVVIDSKVSLTAYERYYAAESDEARAAALKAHVQSVRAHIKTLANKRYDALDSIRSLDFTLLFVPVEPAYFLALQQDPSLVDLAMEQRIMIVSPTTLMAVLRTIDTIWRRERQNQNAIRIAERAGKLYDKVATFADTLEGVGKAINQAQERHHKAVRLLCEGPGNVIRQVEQLREMGAKVSKQMPGEMAEIGLEADTAGAPGLAEKVSEEESERA